MLATTTTTRRRTMPLVKDIVTALDDKLPDVDLFQLSLLLLLLNTHTVVLNVQMLCK